MFPAIQDQYQTNFLTFLNFFERSTFHFFFKHFCNNSTQFLRRIITTGEWRLASIEAVLILFLRSFGIFCGTLVFFTKFKELISKYFTFIKVNFINCLVDIPPCTIFIYVNNIRVYIKVPERLLFIVVASIDTCICNFLFINVTCIFFFFSRYSQLDWHLYLHIVFQHLHFHLRFSP